MELLVVHQKQAFCNLTGIPVEGNGLACNKCFAGNKQSVTLNNLLLIVQVSVTANEYDEEESFAFIVFILITQNEQVIV